MTSRRFQSSSSASSSTGRLLGLWGLAIAVEALSLEEVSVLKPESCTVALCLLPPLWELLRLRGSEDDEDSFSRDCATRRLTLPGSHSPIRRDDGLLNDKSTSSSSSAVPRRHRRPAPEARRLSYFIAPEAYPASGSDYGVMYALLTRELHFVDKLLSLRLCEAQLYNQLR
jgi:hypothetical protein